MRRILLLLLWSSAVLAAPVTYELDPYRTELVALTHPGGIPGASHPHAIVAEKVAGHVVYDPDDVGSSKVKLSFPTDALRADDNALRKREGMDPMSESSRSAVNGNMREEDQMDPKKFPSISFESSAVKKLPDGKLEVKGTMDLRGRQHEYTVPVSVTVKDGVLRGEGTLTIKHSDFFFKPYSAALGAVKNLDEITLKLVLIGKAKAPVAAAEPSSDGGR